VGFGVVWNRDWEAMPQVVDDAPPAHRYFSAGFPTYAQLMYSGEHAVAPGKSETFSVEGDNAELRHYLDCGIIWTAALSGAAGSEEPLLLPLSLGLDAGGGFVRVRLEPAARVRLEPAAVGQARVSEAAGGGL